jgi:hypothetical protein
MQFKQQGVWPLAGNAAPYIEDVFSTYLYTGNSSTQTITNGIDLSTNGGLVWIKSRSNAEFHRLFDTARGVNQALSSNTTNAQNAAVNTVTAFNTTGFNLGNDSDGNGTNTNTYTYASWTFREQPKFFDVVTYTGVGGNNRSVPHNLGSVPGCVIVKRTDSTGSWFVWHRSIGTAGGLLLNATDAVQSYYWDSADQPTSTNILVSNTYGTNANGATYVAYLFAHDAGGFGLTGTDNVISCGSYTGNGSTTGPIITLGYEPQWLMIKRTSSTGSWYIFDSMRGLRNSGGVFLLANSSAAEDTSVNIISALATGFQPVQTGTATNGSGDTYIYIAIRRGPMKVPTVGTSVFYPNAVAQADFPDSTGVPFPPDLVNTFSRNGTDRASSYNQFQFVDRLRSLGTPSNTLSTDGRALLSASTAAEASGTSYVQLKADSQNITRGAGWGFATYGNWIYYFFRRAPSFFDVVCYTGTGSATTVTHNLGVVPELMIVKQRSGGGFGQWFVYVSALGNTKILQLESSYFEQTDPTAWNNTSPTSSVFTVGTAGGTNYSGSTFVAYLFATAAGVSKVGSYTGTGALQTINCGFTSGARFVLIKRSDSTGSWYVWDSARGISSSSDPYLLLNSTAVEVTGTNYVDTDTTGFKVTAAATSDLNGSGGSYIFLAIA